MLVAILRRNGFFSYGKSDILSKQDTHFDVSRVWTHNLHDLGLKRHTIWASDHWQRERVFHKGASRSQEEEIDEKNFTCNGG